MTENGIKTGIRFRLRFTAFEWFLVLGIVCFNVVYSVLQKEINVIGSTAAICGVVCVVLCAQGNILNYVFGLVNVSLYAYISYKSNLLGDAALNAFYYVPMQFIGWFTWLKHKQSPESTQVQARVLSNSNRIVLGAVYIALVVGFGFLLSFLKGNIGNYPSIERYHLYSQYPYKDAITTMSAIIAQFLMARAIMEQWVLWIIMDVVELVIWVMFWLDGEPNAVLMVGMYIFYTINAVNGFIQWNRNYSRKAKPVEA